MLRLNLDLPESGARKLLFLGAHSDDIELGCGGSILELLAAHPGTQVTWVVFSARGERRSEALGSADAFLARAGARDVRTLEYPDSFFPQQSGAIKQEFEALKSVEPDLIFTHHRADLHQDHRLLAELTWNTFRDHTILEYEIPKYDGDLGQPSVFVPIDLANCEAKCRLVSEHFASQRARHWFDPAVFMGLMRIRGMECRSATGYAEAFHARKLVVG